jgi:hypothetical protein
MGFQKGLSRAFLGDLLQRARRATSRRGEMRRLDTQEIQAIAHDLNLSVSELGGLAAVASSSQESLRKHQLHAGPSEDALAVSNCDVLRDLQRVCSECTSKARCAADLRRGRCATLAKYCPNEPTLRALSFGGNKRPSARILTFDQVRV